MRVALTVAGSDPCAGAGIQADLKTFHANQVYGVSAITAITVQNTVKVFDTHMLPPDFVYDQIVRLYEDIPIDAVKIGMLGNAKIILAVAKALFTVKAKNVVLDPVMISKSGYSLTSESMAESIIDNLFPLIDVLTPNTDEATVFTGKKINNIEDMKESAQIIHGLGVGNIALKGGHLNVDQATDILYDGKDFTHLTARWVNTKNSHGTGCTFSSALASGLSKGKSFFESAEDAKHFITNTLKKAIEMGKGNGPLNHFYQWTADS